ncbi:MerR family transcriptional regulator [Rubrivirga sp. S365]|uniref:MerR family transcriptional regulator n=1 Tax=Rubrivirga sp. S365 TaxID=3076080 RepID=UPI0028C90477|nr:MerR family transcriptional regulator [Rubrivirga sp. S365]MDT7858185.1 MerR family transcriptional regulator [Rubrivirga sp. S365]
MAGWTARALAAHTGTPPTTLSSWIGAGLVTPDRLGVGRGGHTIGVVGLLELLAVKELKAAGFSLRAIRRAVGNLRGLSGEDRPLGRLSLVVHGDDIAWRDASALDGMTVSALRHPGQRLMVFHVGEEHTDVVRRLTERVPRNRPPLAPPAPRPSAPRPAP